MKAAAYKQYGDAAMMSLVLDALPKVCMGGRPLRVACHTFVFSQGFEDKKKRKKKN